MDKQFVERWKKIFEHHKATIQDIDEDTQILTWKQDGTIIYSLEFVFRQNKIFVNGDLGYGCFNTTWTPRWDSDWEHIDVGYFASKCECIKDGRYDWDSETAFETIKEYYSSDYDEDEFEDIFCRVKELAEEWDDWEMVKDEDVFVLNEENTDLLKQMFCALCAVERSSSQTDYQFALMINSDFEDFNDFWEWGYNAGCVLNSYFSIWIIALRMAKEQILGGNCTHE